MFVSHRSDLLFTFFPLAAIPDSTPRTLHRHTYRHTHALMLTTWGRCSLAPNVLWRPRSRPLTATQRMSAPSHTCHTCARVHTLAHTHNTQLRGRCSLAPDVLWRPSDRSLAVARRACAHPGKHFTCAHAYTHKHTDLHNAQQRGRCSLAPNVLWRPQDRSLAVARRALFGVFLF